MIIRERAYRPQIERGYRMEKEGSGRGTSGEGKVDRKMKDD